MMIGSMIECLVNWKNVCGLFSRIEVLRMYVCRF